MMMIVTVEEEVVQVVEAAETIMEVQIKVTILQELKLRGLYFTKTNYNGQRLIGKDIKSKFKMAWKQISLK